jgi:hypothetical protein
MVGFYRNAIETARADRRARRALVSEPLHCSINWQCSNVAQRNADAFQAFCESNVRRQQHAVMRHNRSMGVVGTAIAIAIGQRLASKFIKRRDSE